jgi:hypothetical protein
VSIKLDPLFIPLPEKMPPKQGCQIYIGTTYQNWGKYTKFAGKNAAEAGLPDSYWYNIPKLGKIYQICRKKPPKQGCQVYIGTTYQNWGKYTKFAGKSRRSRVARFILVQHTKTGKIYQITTYDIKCTSIIMAVTCMYRGKSSLSCNKKQLK